MFHRFSQEFKDFLIAVYPTIKGNNMINIVTDSISLEEVKKYCIDEFRSAKLNNDIEFMDKMKGFISEIDCYLTINSDKF